MQHKFRFALAAAVTFAFTALAALAITSASPGLFERYYPTLFVLNLVLVTTFFATVVAMIVGLWRRWRRREFGTRMTVKLAVMMTVLAAFPAALLYVVSSAFIARSIESWFDVRVERALDSGVAITRSVLARQQADVQGLAERMAQALSGTPRTMLLNELVHQLEDHAGTDALVLTGKLNVVAAASGSKLDLLLPSLPTPQQVQSARSAGFYSTVDGEIFPTTSAEQDKERSDRDEPTELSVRVIVPIPNSETITLGNLFAPSANDRLYLQLIQPVAPEIIQNAEALLAGYRDYQELLLSRDSLKVIHGTTLTMTLLLAVFGAIAFAIGFARRAAQPLAQLAHGTERLSEGNFQPIREFPGGDEVNRLTTSFNNMIAQLAEAQSNLELQRQRAQQAQAYLERVLSNISSGVMVLDEERRIITRNEGAVKTLDEAHCRVGELLADADPGFDAALERAARRNVRAQSFSLEYELEREPHNKPLFVRTSSMTFDGKTARVVVFDDISPIIDAQRATAWGEVARRLAHEIKNPLTPIRLSAERLLWKLDGKLTEAGDAALLEKTVRTIVTQVDALRSMVDDFREYARLPDAKLHRILLDDFLAETVSLYHTAGLPVVFKPGAADCHIRADVGQLKQVLHNLLSNATDAMAEVAAPEVTVSTYPLFDHDGTRPYAVCIAIADKGPGFPESILAQAFEPYVTTKENGTGLGLPMVKKILEGHGADVRLSNAEPPERGARITMTFQVDRNDN